jgi:hypothetical protein
MARGGSLSHLFMGLMLQKMFGQASSYATQQPTSVWFALSRTVVDSTGGLSEPPQGVYVDEYGERVDGLSDHVASTGYRRVRVPLLDSDWWAESGVSAVVNNDEIRFPEAQEAWGSIRFWAMMSDDERGTVYGSGALRRPVRVEKGDIAVIARGAVHISLDSYDREW